MKNVTISKTKLLQHLIDNREKHIQEYAEALATYRVVLVEEFQKVLDKAKAGEDVQHGIMLTKPVSYVKDYDEAICLLEWNEESEVVLDRAEFNKYVQDEWGWKQTFDAIGASYKSLSALANLN